MLGGVTGMKKLLSLLLSLGIVLFGAAAFAQDTGNTADAPVVVATSTQISGNLYSNMWGNNSVDASLRALLHGYATVAWQGDLGYAIDATVVTESATADDAKGNRTYTMTLADGLCYNDGTPITAADYVFTILLQSDPAIAELGGSNTNFSYLTGYDDYTTGKSGVFSGVQLLGDHQFSITLSKKMLPYYYELALVEVEPTPIAVIAPDYAVKDDGDGAYLAKADEKGTYAAATLPKELLETTLTDDAGYLHQPKVSCGPYQLVEYNAADSTIALEINPKYQGNFESRKPEVKQVKLIQLSDADALTAYDKGEVQIVHKISTVDVITKAQELSGAGTANIQRYLNSGYSYLGFACELAPTNDVDVRKALSMCIDRNTLCTELFQNNALPVYADYGYGQWMVSQNPDLVSGLNINYDLDAAKNLLITAGYTYNEKGKPYQEGVDKVRCKVENGEMTKLELRWAKTESASADYLETQLTAACDALGIKLEVTKMSFADMMKQYLRADGKRDYNLYYMGVNIPYVYDPYDAYNTDEAAQGAVNTTGLQDERLMKAADTLRHVASGDVEQYDAKWLLFQQRWMEMMPNAPIYCNVYCDVCPATLYEYNTHAQYGFASALLYATYTEPEPTATLVPLDTVAPTDEVAPLDTLAPVDTGK